MNFGDGMMLRRMCIPVCVVDGGGITRGVMNDVIRRTSARIDRKGLTAVTGLWLWVNEKRGAAGTRGGGGNNRGLTHYGAGATTSFQPGEQRFGGLVNVGKTVTGGESRRVTACTTSQQAGQPRMRLSCLF